MNTKGVPTTIKVASSAEFTELEELPLAHHSPQSDSAHAFSTLFIKRNDQREILMPARPRLPPTLHNHQLLISLYLTAVFLGIGVAGGLRLLGQPFDFYKPVGWVDGSGVLSPQQFFGTMMLIALGPMGFASAARLIQSITLQPWATPRVVVPIFGLIALSSIVCTFMSVFYLIQPQELLNWGLFYQGRVDPMLMTIGICLAGACGWLTTISLAVTAEILSPGWRTYIMPEAIRRYKMKICLAVFIVFLIFLM